MEPAVVAGVVLAIVLIVGLLIWVGTHAKRTLGDPVLEVGDESPALGGGVSYRVRFDVQGTIRVEHVTVSIRCYEYVEWEESESYTDSKGHSHTRTVTRSAEHELWSDRHRRPFDRPWTAGERPVVEGEFELPVELPPSFEAPDNEIRWRLDYVASVPGWPDAGGTAALRVPPVRLMRRRS